MKNINKNVIIGAIAIILAAVMWSMDGIFIRPQLHELPVWLIVFLEHLLGFAILSPFVIIWFWKIKKLSKKDWFAILRVCVFGWLIGTIFITKAFFLAFAWWATFATVVLLQKLQPVFALFMARIILKEKLRRTFYMRALLAIVAWYFLAFGIEPIDLKQIKWLHSGAFFSVLAAFAFGSSTVFGKRIVNHLDFKITTGLRFGLTSILALILILITKDISSINLINNTQWQYLVIIIFTSWAWAAFLYYFGLKKVKASTSTILELAWPLSAVFVDWLVYRNMLNWIQIIASFVLLISFFMIIREQKQRNIIFKSNVIKGYWQGKKLGFHTANLENTNIDIPHWVYICKVNIEKKIYSWLMHFWFVETFERAPSLEIFIKDFSGDLYTKDLEVTVWKKLRNIKKFNSAQELKQQISKDVESLK